MRTPSVTIVSNKSCSYPPTHGAARRIWGLAGALSRLGLSVNIIDSSVGRAVRHQQIGEIRFTSFPYPAPFSSAVRAPRALRTASPVQRIIRSGPQFNPMHTAYLAKLRSHSMLDIVQVEFPFPILEALPLHAFGARLLLDEHGVETDFLHEILTSIGKSPMSLESAQVSFLERLAVQAASSVLCCSEHDKARIMDLYGGRSSKFLVVENGIEDEFFQPVEPFKFPDPTVLFLGSFNHSPNLYAIDWIVQQVVPRVQRIAPKTKFVFVGSGSVELPRVNESMVIRDVKDVRPYIRGAQVGLATVFHGSGSRLKILEYSACGLPVIASTKGIEGLDLEPDSEVLVANDPDSVATAIIELLTDRYLAMQLAANAQAKVRSKHSWLTIASKALPAYSP